VLQAARGEGGSPFTESSLSAQQAANPQVIAQWLNRNAERGFRQFDNRPKSFFWGQQKALALCLHRQGVASWLMIVLDKNDSHDILDGEASACRRT